MVCNKKYWKSFRLRAKLDELTQYNSVPAFKVKKMPFSAEFGNSDHAFGTFLKFLNPTQIGNYDFN